MIRQIAFLRGINISGKNRIPMAELKACFEGLGFADVKTYLNSGNIAFSSDEDDEDILAGQIEQLIKEKFGISIPAFVISREELEDVLRHEVKVYQLDVDLERINRVLVTSGIGVSELSVKKGNLEEYFLKLTGGVSIG